MGATVIKKWSGIGMPVIRYRGGYFSPRDEVDLVWSSMVMILGTPTGTRIMLPEFGSEIPALVFEPIDEVLHALLRRHSIEAIQKWEPRVNILNFVSSANENTISMQITFSLKSDPTVNTRGFTIKRFDSFQILNQF